MGQTTEYNNPTKMLQDIIRFNTTNPPGNERECILYIKNILDKAGFKTAMYGINEERQNLVAVLEGRGEKPPLMMYGHVDVVTTELQKWDYPPFEGVIADDCIWGRGALDMKGAVVMMICAVIRAKNENFTPAGDIILTIVCDEENTGYYGSRYLVENHRELFKNVKYAIGEIGGFTMRIGGKRFYPIMVGEKQKCCINTTLYGPGGHGSMPMRNGAMAKLGHVLAALNKNRLPVHITQPVQQMIEALYKNMDFPAGMFMKGLLNPMFTDKILDMMGDKGRIFDPLLHNTVNATIVNGGHKINVIPSEINLEFDGRMVPGAKPEDIIRELKDLLGKEFEFNMTIFDPGPGSADMALFSTLSEILRLEDKEGIPIPYVVCGVTDARFFSRLGIQTYGFTPMILPDNIDFSKLIHNENERIPIAALEFGVKAITELIKRY